MLEDDFNWDAYTGKYITVFLMHGTKIHGTVVDVLEWGLRLRNEKDVECLVFWQAIATVVPPRR